MNFAPICDSRVPHIRQVCCGLGFLFGAKFPQSPLILWWCVGITHLSICTFGLVGHAFLFGTKLPQSPLILWWCVGSTHLSICTFGVSVQPQLPILPIHPILPITPINFNFAIFNFALLQTPLSYPFWLQNSERMKIYFHSLSSKM